MNEDAALAELARELDAVVTVTEPEELIAQGQMPQVPYRGQPYTKTQRGPEGWERVLKRATNTITAAGEQITRVTPRLVTVERGREWYLSDDPDVPRQTIDRLAIVGMAATEEGEATHWLVVHEKVGYFVESGSWTTDRTIAEVAFISLEAVLTEGLEGRRDERNART